MLNKKLKFLRKNWEQECLKLSPPKSEEQILQSFLKIDKLISKDVLEFYSIVGGMVEYESDSEHISFWSLEQILKENLLYESELTLFADFLIHSQFWGFKYEDSKTSSVYIDYMTEKDEYVKVADSVEEFVDLYLDNPDNIF